jgi:mono/diheme cytochrome c family protein
MKTVIWTIVVVVILGLAGGIYFMYSGVYDVAATSEDSSIMRWVLHTTREESIERRAEDVIPPADTALSDPENIRIGFEHYDEMCVVCHGAPGVEPGEAREGLNPKPPLLAKMKEDIPAKELFWVIKHGIKMTGMPAWGPTHSDDKIWAMVAFVKKLHELSPADYQAMRQETAGSEDEDEGMAASGHHHE